MMLSNVCLSVCLSVAYIGPKSRTERPRKTKIGTEVAHVTRDSDTTFKVKRSKGQRSRSPGRFTHRGVYASGSCSGERGNVLTVGTHATYVAIRRGRLGGARGFSAHRGRKGAGAYCDGSRRTACYAALLPRRGPHIASHSVCLSVCLSVRPSRACLH